MKKQMKKGTVMAITAAMCAVCAILLWIVNNPRYSWAHAQGAGIPFTGGGGDSNNSSINSTATDQPIPFGDDPLPWTEVSNNSTSNYIRFLEIPQSTAVTVGETVTLSVAVTSDDPNATFTYQWQAKSPKGNNWANSSQSGATTNTLSIATTVNHNGYKYRCLVKDDKGHESASPSADLLILPAITSQPKSLNVTVGDKAVFSVKANGKATLKYQWQAKSPSATEWSNSTQSGAKTNTLTVSTNVNHNNYQYRCVVADGNGMVSYSDAATLTIAPKITTHPADAEVTVGDKAVFSVAVNGKAKVKYQWQAKSPSATEWSNSTQSGAKTATLTVSTNVNHNNYQYRCVVTDGNGKEAYSDAATLTILPKITAHPKDADVTVGSKAVFSVAVTGKATLKYQWQYKGPKATSWSNSTQSGAKTATLTVTTNIHHNGYQYRCVITDGNKKQVTSDPAKLTVTEAGIAIDAAHFPNNTFREYVKSFDTDGNGSLSKAELVAVKTISITDAAAASLEGIEYFTELTSLTCSGNGIPSLDLQANTKLQYLDCSDNELDSLNLNQNTALTYLNCSYNALTSLTLNLAVNLEEIDCHYNNLTGISVGENIVLQKLDCRNNSITGLYMDQCWSLDEVWCDGTVTDIFVRAQCVIYMDGSEAQG